MWVIWPSGLLLQFKYTPLMQTALHRTSFVIHRCRPFQLKADPLNKRSCFFGCSWAVAHCHAQRLMSCQEMCAHSEGVWVDGLRLLPQLCVLMNLPWWLIPEEDYCFYLSDCSVCIVINRSNTQRWSVVGPSHAIGFEGVKQALYVRTYCHEFLWYGQRKSASIRGIHL